MSRILITGSTDGLGLLAAERLVSSGHKENLMDAELIFIGKIKSNLTSLKSCPKQGSEGAPQAQVEIFPKFRDALKGVTPGDRVVVLTWLHKADRGVLQVHPRGNRANPLTGVFLTRSQARPNPVGLHPVQVLSVDEQGITVAPMEAIDGTPVIDIKVELSPEK